MLFMSSVNGTSVQIALDKPSLPAVVASANVTKSQQLQLVSIPLESPLTVRGQTIFLLLEGDCHIDYFRFRAFASVTARPI